MSIECIKCILGTLQKKEQTFRFGLILAIEIAIFGPSLPWIGAWKG